MTGSRTEPENREIEKKLREKQPRERAHTNQAGPEEDETAGRDGVRATVKTCKEGGVVFAACTVLPHIEWRRGKERAVLHSDQGSSVRGGER